MRLSLRVNLLHWHIRDTLVILEEVKIPHPRCPHCDILVPLAVLNSRHPTISQCAKGKELKRWRLKAEGGGYVKEHGEGLPVLCPST